MYRKEVVQQLQPWVSLDTEQLYGLIEVPKDESHGDLAFPCFTLAKTLRKAPQVIAQELAEKVNGQLLPLFEKAVPVGGYLNFFIKRSEGVRDILSAIQKQGDSYGNTEAGKGKTVAIDLSSPNIAKPFSMGHLRSTVIGNAISNILESQGYKVVRINHLGDWGTQFGKLIVAYRMWGQQLDLEDEPIKKLLDLYVRFHEEAEKHPELDEQARAAFKALEDGREEEVALWKRFIEISLAEFKAIYKKLGVEFDAYSGESFYNDKMDAVVEELERKHLLEKSQGADVVDLSAYNMPPCLIRKSDGATLYATRDLAAALYRHREYHADKLLYVVGGEQKLHFQQVFKVLELMGYEWAKECTHIAFGMMRFEGKKMSTRKGQVVLLEEVLTKAVDLARQIIEEKNPNLPDKEQVAEAVGVGAIIFNDLKNNRLHDIDFHWEEALNFDGETGPYVQYTYARLSSLLRKGNYDPSHARMPEDLSAVTGDTEWSLVKWLGRFENVLDRASEQYDPSLVAKYVIDICQLFNRYYNTTRILEGEAEEIAQKLTLVACTRTVIGKCLHLLGLKSLEMI
ncbi:arginine--tRNA ligase [Collibacillus ludicampi]|uniref:Arginine--tRNA ligase n=1 Tax=Collibacillus ludicampi TaxID=2771369 RepID=A0AAV4LCB0_9BACL|nr:arginine--tRNA ligase [Collibacillus ludicampi]GIM45460.1 arginine--tRNA ligase [Collibacillus ludicampi]